MRKTFSYTPNKSRHKRTDMAVLVGRISSNFPTTSRSSKSVLLKVAIKKHSKTDKRAKTIMQAGR